MALPLQLTLRWATEADFDDLADVMFAAVREGDSPYTEAQRQVWVPELPEPRRGPAWRARLLSEEIIVAGADGRLLGFMSLAEGGYIDFAYIRAEARGAGLLLRGPHRSPFGLWPCRGLHSASCSGAFGACPTEGRAPAVGPREPHRRTAFAALGFAARRREQVTIAGEVEMEMIL